MAYCTSEDLLKMIAEEELAELSAETGDAPNLLVVEEAIAKAGAEVDAYLGVRYQTPVSPVPLQIRGVVVDMAIHHLYTRRGAAPPVRRERYEAAVRFLKDVAGGQAVVAGLTGEIAATERETTEIAAAVRIFSRDSQADW
jgi:phage gp36-like protein